MKKKKLIIFASGNGSNVENIYHYFEKHDPNVEIAAIYTNNPKAYVIERAKKLGLNYRIFNKEEFKTGIIESELATIAPNLIILAGFLWLIPKGMVRLFPNKIINIHPALLPNYGGKGMYGNHVHKAVLKNGDKVSGITMHFVNEKYDEGNIIEQVTCDISEATTADQIASRVHKLEYEHYPKVIEKLLKKQ